MHTFDIFGHILVIVMSLRSSEGNQRVLQDFGLCFEHCFDIRLVDPGSIQESSGTIFKHFEYSGTPVV